MSKYDAELLIRDGKKPSLLGFGSVSGIRLVYKGLESVRILLVFLLHQSSIFYSILSFTSLVRFFRK